MKKHNKPKINKSLNLTKQTITNLTATAMTGVHGGNLGGPHSTPGGVGGPCR